MVRAPAPRAARTSLARNARSARVASIGENSTSPTACRARVTIAAVIARTSSWPRRSWCSSWTSLALTNTWMRGDAAPASASIAASMAPGERAHAGVSHTPGDGADRTKLRGRRGRKSRLDDVDAHRLEAIRDVELVLLGEEHAGGLLAVAQGRVENGDSVGHGKLLRFAGRRQERVRPAQSSPIAGGGREGRPRASGQKPPLPRPGKKEEAEERRREAGDVHWRLIR